MNAEIKGGASLAANPFDVAPVVAAPTGASAGALMQREASEIQTAMLIARRFPRDQRAAMDRILTSCTRETLAEEALYEFARGGQQVTGPSIRLAEEMARQWGNILSGVAELSRHGGQSEVIAYCMDLETGYRDEKRFMVRHWRDTKSGGHAISEERDIYEHLANYAARRKRACILAIIPIDVQEAAVKQVELTLAAGKAAVTPENRQKLVDRFAKLGVTTEMIEKNIQRRLDSITPALYARLGKIYTSLKDGMSQVSDWFEVPAAPAATDEAPATNGKGNAGAKEKLQRAAATSGPAVATANAAANATAAEEVIPHYDTASAIAALSAARGSPEKLQAAWKAIVADYQATSREMPVMVEGTHNELTEASEESL